MIIEYRIYLFNEWYNGLSDEQRKIYDKRIEARKEKDRRLTYAKINAILNILGIIYEKGIRV